MTFVMLHPVPVPHDGEGWTSLFWSVFAVVIAGALTWMVIDARHARQRSDAPPAKVQHQTGPLVAFDSTAAPAARNEPLTRIDLSPAAEWMPEIAGTTTILANGSAFPRGSARVRRASALDPGEGGKLVPGDSVVGDGEWSLIAGDEGATLLVIVPASARERYEPAAIVLALVAIAAGILGLRETRFLTNVAWYLGSSDAYLVERLAYAVTILFFVGAGLIIPAPRWAIGAFVATGASGLALFLAQHWPGVTIYTEWRRLPLWILAAFALAAATWWLNRRSA